jgi:hypothetical protein
MEGTIKSTQLSKPIPKGSQIGLPKVDKETTKSTQQSKPIPKGSQSGVIHPPVESNQRKPDSNVKQTKSHGKTHKGVNSPLISKKLPVVLQAHQGWDYIGAA